MLLLCLGGLAKKEVNASFCWYPFFFLNPKEWTRNFSSVHVLEESWSCSSAEINADSNKKISKQLCSLCRDHKIGGRAYLYWLRMLYGHSFSKGIYTLYTCVNCMGCIMLADDACHYILTKTAFLSVTFKIRFLKSCSNFWDCICYFTISLQTP